MIFALIDTFTAEKLKIRDYKALSDIKHREYISELERESENNSAEAKYHLSVDFHARALRECDIECLNEAELRLRSPAELGWPEAEFRLSNNWVLMKRAALRKIERSNKS